MRVAYNDALRRLFNFNWHYSASGMFASMNILSFDAIQRKCIYKFMQRFAQFWQWMFLHQFVISTSNVLKVSHP